MTLPRDPKGFKELGKIPCPVCAHKDRCKIDSTGDWVLCFRLADAEINAFRLIKHTRGCSTYLRIGSPADGNNGAHSSPPSALRLPAPPSKLDLDTVAAEYADALTAAHADQFGQELGVSAVALRRLSAGLNGSRLCFPERDATGKVIGISTRYPDQKRRYLVGDGHQRGLLIPDGLPEQHAHLLFPEGPSDVCACLDLGLNAVGRPNNASKADLIADYARRVGIPIILGENDQKPDGSWPGRDGAQHVAREVGKILGRLVLWALVPTGFKDARDFLKANATRDRFEVGRELLFHIYSTAVAVEPSVSNVSAVSGDSAENWPDPQPLPKELPPVVPFDLELLPEALRDWVRDIAERAQCPADFPAVGAMVSLASLAGRKVAIRPKRRDDWTAVPNLWGGVIGRPGLLKTPMLQEATRPLRRLEAEAKAEYETQCKESLALNMVRDAQRKKLKKAVEEAVKAEEDAEAVARDGLTEETDCKLPVRRRYLLNDVTVEKLGVILNENPNGVLTFRDELIGLLRTLCKEGHECDRAFYLEAWDGKSRFTYDRIGRGTIDIESAIVSILGGIQPSVLQTFLRTSLDQVGNDGLIQRFQLLVWPDVPKEWVNIDEWPNTEAKNRAYAAFTALNELTPEAVHAEQSDDSDIPFLRFDREAQLAFDDWRAALEGRLRSEDLHPIFEEHLSKFRGLIPSLALLIHLIDGGVGPVPIGPLRKAMRWAEYLESHALRVYHVASNPDIPAATALARKIVKGEIADGFALRDVYRHEWSGLTDREVVQGAAELLCDLDWLRCTREQTQGAPKVRYWINPKIAGLTRKPPVKTDKSPENDLPSVLSGPSGEHSQDFGETGTESDLSDKAERDAIWDVEREAEEGDQKS